MSGRALLATKTTYRLGLLVICLLAFALRLHLLEDIFLSEDEEKSILLYVQQPVEQIWRHYEPNNHWLASGLGHGLGQLGQQRFWLRWPSVLFGTLAIPLTSLAGCWLLHSRSYGWLAAFWLALSAFHVRWSQQFRGYSALLFFTLLSLLLLYQALRTGRKQYWWGFWGSMALTLASHLYGVLVLIVAAALVMSWRWSRLTTRAERLPQKQWAWTVCGVVAAVGGYLIWFGKVYVINFYHASPKATLTQQLYYQWLALGPTLPEVSDFLKAMALAFTAHTNGGVALVLFGGLAVAGLAFASTRLPWVTLFLGVWLIGPLIVVIMAEFAVAGFFVFNRFLIFVLPAWLLLASIGLTHGSKWLARRLAPVGPRYSIVFGGLLFASLSYMNLLNLSALQAYFTHQASNDWRGVAAYLADRIEPNDLVICDQVLHRMPPHSQGDNPCVLELRRRLTTSLPAPAVEIVAADEIEPYFKNRDSKFGAVWLVIWGINNPLTVPVASFERLGYTTLLKADTEPTQVANLNQVVTYLTKLDLLFTFPAHKLNANFGNPPSIRLLGYTLPATLQAGQATPVITFWQTLAPVSTDYTIFLHLRNSANQTVTQLDFRPFDGAYPTSHWLPGSTIEETRLWTLPADLPPGPYTLHLGLYQVQTLARLPLKEDQDGENALRLGQVWLE